MVRTPTHVSLSLALSLSAKVRSPGQQGHFTESGRSRVTQVLTSA